MEYDRQLFSAIQAEITDDIEAGTIPVSVASFGELHDYVDANEYGAAVYEKWGALDISKIDAARCAIDEWLKTWHDAAASAAGK